MIVTIASGKGGTGKTTVAVSLALSLTACHRTSTDHPLLSCNPLFLDCDVEEPNAALFLRPTIEERREVGVLTPQVDFGQCTYCGRCAEVCQYHAIAVVGARRSAAAPVLVFPELCHGCGSCTLNCPAGAIREVLHVTGAIERGWAGPVEFAQGTMNVGEPMAVPIIRQLKRWAIPPDTGDRPVILDAPPGTACPVVEAMRGADFVLLVTEPTVSGVHDLERILATTGHFGVPSLVVINKADLNPARADEVAAFCAARGLTIAGRIPYDDVVTEAMVQGRPVTEHADGPVAEALRDVWAQVKIVYSKGAGRIERRI